MAIMRLDRDGNAPVPDGYILVTTEIDFLRVATENRPLHIRGDRLCSWAEAFFNARDIRYQVTPSYLKELRSLLPALSSAQISALIDLLGPKLETLPRPLDINSLVNAVAPHSLWYESPSLQHLASWLLWLADDQDNIEIISPLIESKITRWQTEDLPFDSQLYSIRSKEAACESLCAWLGIFDRDIFSIKEEFPLEVPVSYQEKARQVWRERIIETKGNEFSVIANQRIPFSLKGIAANEAYEYYLYHPNDLDSVQLEGLIPYLRSKQISKLRTVLPPAIPSELPNDPDAVIEWYLQEYLPYREWQSSSPSEEGKRAINQSARQFELWYLETYPRGLNGSSLHRHLSFNKINQIECPENCLTLVIILDGMHVIDSRILLQNVRSQTQRISITSEDYVYAPIPTVTRFAKEALLKGVPPDRAQEYEPIGMILPEKYSPAQRLSNAEDGKIYIWRVMEPDNTYHHKNNSENLLHDVEGRLAAEALKIKEIVETIPDDRILQIILTTDHGRLLSETLKTVNVPSNMESHGRAAWGKSPVPFEDGPYCVQDDVAYLMGESYGMLSDIALPMDESAFKDNSDRTGSELFPHGGIYPEEVILPWIVLARDLAQPDAIITITGNGRARREGNFKVVVNNKSDIELALVEIRVSLRMGTVIPLKFDFHIPPRSQERKEIPYEGWPSPGDLQNVKTVARVRLPNQMVFEYPVEATITSEDIYIRPKDNILEDMD